MQVRENDLDTYSLQAADNPDYVCAFIEYCRTGADRLSGELSADQQVALGALCLQAGENLKAELEDLRNIAWHWALKASVDSLWASHWDRPRCKTLYGLWDHMVPPFYNL